MLTKSITKLLKKSARVICQPDESGVIYVTDGHLIAVVTPVIWITAADPDAAEAIRRAGGRWAEKKSAFYISVA